MTQNALTPIDQFKNMLDAPLVRRQLENALGKNADVFTASLLDTYIGELQKYDQENIIAEAMKAAVLNLPIAKSLGFAYLVPYKGRIQFQMGYKGLIQLAMRSGQVKTINAGPIYEGELSGIDKLRGLYDFSGEKETDVVVGYFAYLQLINGFEKTVYWTREQVIKHAEAKSQAYRKKKGPWLTDFDAMGTKTVIIALFSKYAPMTVDFQRAIEFDEVENIDITDEVNAELNDFKDGMAEKSKAPPRRKRTEPKKEAESAEEAPPEGVHPAREELSELVKSPEYSEIYPILKAAGQEHRDVDAALDDETGEKAQAVLDILKERK